MIDHQNRKHSRFSASGSDRWLNCPASVRLEELSPPSVDTHWSLEGTKAHEILERILLAEPMSNIARDCDRPMLQFCVQAAERILWIKRQHQGLLLVEKKIFNTFIHEDMFGTCDAVVVTHDKHLHIIDFKYGQGHVVSAVKNTQLIQYALGAAESYDWKFKLVTMHILQPRAGGNWHKEWTIPCTDLKKTWLPLWEKGVARALKADAKPFEGSHCHWCRARAICPLKLDSKRNGTINVFENSPLERESYGKEESNKKEIRKEKGSKKTKSASADFGYF